MSDSPLPTPNSDDLDALMAGYVLDTLSPEEQAELEQRLQRHPDLTLQIRSLQEVMGLLAHTTRQPAPAHLRARILAIPQTPTAAPRPTPQMARRWSHWAWGRIGGAIAATLIVGLGLDNYWMRQRLASLEAAIADPHPGEDYAFTLQGEGNVAAATVILNAEQGRVFVGVKQLPPLPADQTYYLWAITDDQQRILCGQFNTNAAGQWVSQIQVDPAIYTGPVAAMEISREPLNATPTASPATVVLTSKTHSL